MKKFFYNLKMTYEYIKDKNVPIYRKVLIILGFTYFIFPVDIVPDFIIGLGLIDDVAVLAFLWNAIRSEISDYAQTQERMTYEKAKVIEFSAKRKSDKTE